MSNALTWDELANLYDQENKNGRRARTLPMNAIFEWAERQPDRFYVLEPEGTIHLKQKGVI